MNNPIKNVMVVGYGTMGRGIAISFARGGFETTVLSRDPSRIDDLPNGVAAIAEPPAEAPDLIIESIPEDMALKRALFARLEGLYGGQTIYSTNTSGLPIEDIAAPLERKDRFLAIHYMQPAEAFPMVEVCRIEETADAVLARTVEALEGTGKHSIVLNKPVIGFLINRLQHAILHEAYYMIEEGVVTVEDVDHFARWGFGPRMCVTGLLEQKDISGVNVTAAAQRGIVPDLHHNRTPCTMVQDMVANGDWGVATGKGFYDWQGRDVAARKAEAADKLARLLALLGED